MSNKFDERQFNQWLKLRAQMKQLKAKKQWLLYEACCQDILSLADIAKHIQIFTPLVHKEIGIANEKCGKLVKAISQYQIAITELKRVREAGEIASSDDWINEISICERKIFKLESCINKTKMTNGES